VAAGWRGPQPVTRNVAERLPYGADASAVVALKAVQRYQDQRPAASPDILALPSCWLGFFHFGGCEESDAPADAETAVCEELKVWLLSAATGAVPAGEVAQRLGFYRQILMRPETFSESAFLSLVSTVCERLDELLERLAGAVRTCALQLNKVLSIGRDLVNGIMPVLLLAITDAVGDGVLAHLGVEALAASAITAARQGQAADMFARWWQTDSGRILRELLCSPHFGQLWGFELLDGSCTGAEYRGVPDIKLELYHKWDDALAADQPLSDSGLQDYFQAQHLQDVQQTYLALYEDLDKFVKFLSMIEHYKLLANIAGDAAMYHLRVTLHHLLQEVELVVVRVEAAVSKIMKVVKGAVIDLTLRPQSPSAKQLIWLERLQHIDECARNRSYRNLVTAMAELRYLSCDARLPALQAACERSFHQISDITTSQEFRSRCTESPPEPGSIAIPAPTAMAPLANGAASAVEDELPWSLERQFRLTPEELQGPALGEEQLQVVRQCSASELGAVVEDLNQGRIPDPGDFCLVQCEESQEYITLHKTGRREAAVGALGLNEASWKAEASGRLAQHLSELATAVATPALEPEVPAAVECPSEKQAGKETKQGQLQSCFYEVLFAAVLPLFEQEEFLSGEQVLALLQRSELSQELIDAIFAIEVQGKSKTARVDCKMLERMGQLVAHAQAGCEDLKAVKGTLPSKVPNFRGFLWDEQRPKKMSVLEPF